LARYGKRKLLAILAAQVVTLQITLTDAGVEMFCKLIGGRFTRSANRQKASFQQRRKEASLIARRFSALVATIHGATQNGADVGQAIAAAHDLDELSRLKSVAEDLANLGDSKTSLPRH
jgi:hypothetical protein